MLPRSMIAAMAVLLTATLGAGCSETVGYMNIDLVAPVFSPEIRCENDPRRARTVRVEASCTDSVHEATYTLSSGDHKAGSFSLGEVSLGDCTVKVEVKNAHGRVILAGQSQSLPVSAGDNDDLEIPLLEERCLSSLCDGDGDKLADLDESGLKTDAAKVDSDGDGLEDGLEVRECCTDPLVTSSTCPALHIQRVVPEMGLVGASVLISTSVKLQQPKVSLGGAALQSLFSDNTIAFGLVAPQAALGEVQVTSGGTSAAYRNLFAVLRGQPQSVIEASTRAVGAAPVMRTLVDQAFVGGYQLLLGRSQGVTSSGSAGVVQPVLIVIDLAKAQSIKAALPGLGSPLAMAVHQNRVMLLLENKGVAALAYYDLSATSLSLGALRKVKLDSAVQTMLVSPTDLELEVGGNVVQVLTRDRLVRLELKGGTVSRVAARTLTPPGAKLASGNTKAFTACTGLVIHAPPASLGAAVTYASCNRVVLCLPGKPCKSRSSMVRVPSSCLGFKSVSQIIAEQKTFCGSSHDTAGVGVLVGKPVISPDLKAVFLLGSVGVFSAPLTGTPPGAWTAHIDYSWKNKPTAAGLMAAHGKYLYVVDGPRVWRMEPHQKEKSRRIGRPFLISQGTQEQATMVGVRVGGTVLSVGRTFGNFSSLLPVCLGTPCK